MSKKSYTNIFKIIAIDFVYTGRSLKITGERTERYVAHIANLIHVINKG